MTRCQIVGCLAIALTLLASPRPAGSQDSASGRRQLPAYEADVYGPLPYSEEVTTFLEQEITYLLARQARDGSWPSAQPIGGGRTEMEAGGTVDNVTLTSMCGYSLRRHAEVHPQAINRAISLALRFVLRMVASGKLRNQVSDAPWRYTYTLRFLRHEYGFVEDPGIRRRIRDACSFLLDELKDLQQGTTGEKSHVFPWRKPCQLGMRVEDVDGHPVVRECPTVSAAYKAGFRAGDRLISANCNPIGSELRYHQLKLGWLSGDTIEFKVERGSRSRTFRFELPGCYPGTLGLRLDENATVTGFEFLSDRTNSGLQIGDRITRVGRTRVTGSADLEGFVPGAGQEVKLTVMRGRRRQTLDFVCAPVPVADFGVDIQQGLDQSDDRGLRVGSVRGGSCLARAGLRPGDRILRIDDCRVINRRHFMHVERSIWGGKTVTVEFLAAGEDTTRVVEVVPPAYPDSGWLEGFSGLEFGGNRTTVSSVVYGSPADRAGVTVGDLITHINGTEMADAANARDLLNSLCAGKEVRLVVERDGVATRVGFATNRRPDSVWISSDRDAGGGWEYYSRLKGGSTFLTSDTLRELVLARTAIPELQVPDEMIERAFRMLTRLRKKQPISTVESYRYDAAGSFWSVEDIRGDIGRLNSAELALVMATDAKVDTDGSPRTQKHLELTLREWLKHRGILDLVKFPKGHDAYSIAPYYWMYSYRTTLEAAAFFTADDELRTEVQRIALKAFFQHMKYQHEDMLGGKGWIIGLDRSKELHDSCQLLDGLSTIKHLYEPRLRTDQDDLREACAAFNGSRYGEAFTLLESSKLEGKRELEAEITRIRLAIEDRFVERLTDVKAIHRDNAYDGLHHLRQMRDAFSGHPRLVKVEELIASWSAALRR